MKKEEKNEKRIVIIEKGVDLDRKVIDGEFCCWAAFAAEV